MFIYTKEELYLVWRMAVLVFWTFLLISNTMFIFNGSIPLFSLVGAVCAGYLTVSSAIKLNEAIKESK